MTSYERSALLLMYTGSPPTAAVPDIQAFLTQFFADKAVFRLNATLHYLLRTIVPPRRARRLQPHYLTISINGTSAQHYYLQRLCRALTRSDLKVVYALLYAPPQLPEVLSKLQQNGITRLIVLPLYPQDSGTTHGAAQAQLNAALTAQHYAPQVHWLPAYGQHDAYLQAICQQLKHLGADKLARSTVYFSYHSVPVSYLRDPREQAYIASCHTCSHSVAERCALTAYKTVFQSAMGPLRWQGPTLKEALRQHNYAASDAVVICPGFAIDCLETIYEVNFELQSAVRAKHSCGFTYVPCLNDSTVAQQLINTLLMTET